MAKVLDLRGRQLVVDRTPVLLDPSGGRARVLAWVGRAVAVVFLVWLFGLVFAGLGLLPSSDLPLGRAFVGQSPPGLKTLPPITQPAFAGRSTTAASATGTAIADGAAGSNNVATAMRAAGSTGLTPAGSSDGQAGPASPTRSGHGHAPATGTAGAGSGASTRGTVTTGAAASNPNSGLRAAGSGPGRTVSQSSPGHLKSTTGTGSSSGHGRQTTTSGTTTTPGNSGHTFTR